jgi:hypothetical protein
VESRAERLVLDDDPQAASRSTGSSSGTHNTHVRAAVAAADPPAQLVELGHAEQVGPVDDHRVHVRQIDPRLDDRGGHEHVARAIDEVHEHPLEHVGVHLAVGRRDARLGHPGRDLLGDLAERLDPVVHDVDLPAAFESR